MTWIRRAPPPLLLVLALAACGGKDDDSRPGEGTDPAETTEEGTVDGPRIVTRAVAYRHGDADLEGYLAYDAAREGKRPGVLVVHEWWGLTEHPRERARRLAGMGFVALAADMYGKGKTTGDPQQAGTWSKAFGDDPHGFGRARALAGLEQLKQDERVDPERLAAIGFCYGGRVAMEVAWSGAPVDAVVSFHGNPAPPPEEDADGVKAAVLVLHGAADPLVPRERIEAFRSALDATDIEWRLVEYEGAVHAFTNPGADEHGIEGVAYQAEADRASWQAMEAFFAEHLK